VIRTSTVSGNQSHNFHGDGFLVIKNLVKAFPQPDGSQSVVLNGIDLTIGDEEYISVIGH
jgi:ABC-type nitrate/sulfonate/bicarbonate transport system ATPase subunit